MAFPLGLDGVRAVVGNLEPWIGSASVMVDAKRNTGIICDGRGGFRCVLRDKAGIRFGDAFLGHDLLDFFDNQRFTIQHAGHGLGEFPATRPLDRFLRLFAMNLFGKAIRENDYLVCFCPYWAAEYELQGDGSKARIKAPYRRPIRGRDLSFFDYYGSEAPCWG